jgi:hypothetical protein
MKSSDLLKEYQGRGINIYQESAIKQLIEENKLLSMNLDTVIKEIADLRKGKVIAFIYGMGILALIQIVFFLLVK